MDDEIERELRELCEGDEDLMRALSDPLFWEPPEFDIVSRLPEMLARIEAEHHTAEVLCASLLTGPSSRWPERLRAIPGTRTAGMVQQLLERVPALVAHRPAEALQVTSMAMAFADRLDPRDYWLDYIMMLRAQALREHALVLSFLRRDTEAMKYVNQAELIFAQLLEASYEVARLRVVKATLLYRENRYEEAIALIRAAAETFLEYEDRPRHVNARNIEAALLYASGAVERALEVWTSIKDDRVFDAPTRQHIAVHIASCLALLARRAEAAV